jgi:hypothetical protein
VLGADPDSTEFRTFTYHNASYRMSWRRDEINALCIRIPIPEASFKSELLNLTIINKTPRKQ